MREVFIVALILIGSFSFTSVFAANANLFVSAENSQFDNYMSGPQVIEVVVIDSDINDTDEAKGEPDVTVNGLILRMVQAVDGNWYGYFADRRMALIADSTTSTVGEGLDFGSFCGPGSSLLDGQQNVTFTDTDGIAVNSAQGIQGTNPATPSIPNCNDAIVIDGSLNVVREAKDENMNSPIGTQEGQIGISLTDDAWPFIQLYNLNPTGNVIVQYNKGGGAQTTTLTFDTVDQFTDLELDSPIYKNGTDVLVIITDLWLNIDPTDEDSWTFGTFGITSTNYQVFDENGIQRGDLVGGVFDISPVLDDLMCTTNCVLIINPDVDNTGYVITLQDNEDSEIRSNLGPSQDPTSWETRGNSISGNMPVTMTEQGPNSGVFGSYDELTKSNIVITENPAIGSSASIMYDEITSTFLATLTEHLVIFNPGSSGINCNPSCLQFSELPIFPGDSVTWHNGDVAIHEVVSGTPGGGPDGTFDSGFILPGGDFSFVFTAGGTFPYYDLIHPWITSSVDVIDLTPTSESDVVIDLDGHKISCPDSMDCYVPQSLSIEPGTEVIWFNADKIEHAITSGTPGDAPGEEFDLGPIQPGDQFSHTFLEVGTYSYFDSLHTWAIGEIIVTPVFPPGIDVLLSLGSSSSGCEIMNTCFIPSEFTANFGDTVTWLNADDAGHTITSGTPGGGPDGEFDSGLVFPGGNFSNNFSEDGVFPYYDVIHPWAVGSVTVNPQDCIVPSTGVWTITQNCKLISNATTPANVLVQNNSTLTIPSGITLIIPSSQNIIIESGSGVVIKDGGTLKVIG
jgi:plastocyanin